MKIRSGIGYDLHRLVPGRGLFIGGVKVSDSLSALAHSDGDVLIHALIDSLLGATGDLDIGQLFPDNDPSYKNASGARLLSQVMDRLKAGNWQVVSVDSVVIIDLPRLAPFKEQIRNRLAELLNISPEDINVKGKSREGLTAQGGEEAIEAFAISMVRRT